MQEIEERAEQVLAAVPPYIWDGKRPPIPVEEIASSCYGLLVRDIEDLSVAPGSPKLEADETLSGLLLTARREIWVNAAEAREWPPRRRFTIGHELGHWVLHRDRADAVFCRSNLVQPDEQPAGSEPDVPDIEEEASNFAAALLMPAELIRTEYARNRDFEHLCRTFNASGAAMGRRLHAVI